jgi:hypothetical protein
MYAVMTSVLEAENMELCAMGKLIYSHQKDCVTQ